MTGSFAAPGLRRLVHRVAARPPLAPGVPPLRGAEAGGGNAADQEHCDLCAEPVPPAHRHLVDTRADTVLCACRVCALLFDREPAGGGHYRLLPDRRIRLDGFRLDDVDWAGVNLPVDLVFFVRAGESGEITARYPSPLGTLRADVDATSWAAVERVNPVLRDLADDVEALLVDRTGTTRRYWLLPLDDCYRLAAVVRTYWSGLGGGAEVHRHIDGFFADLAAPAGGRSAGHEPQRKERT